MEYKTLNKPCALELLNRNKPELQARFGVTQLTLFGSTSDVDILIAFDGPATIKK